MQRAYVVAVQRLTADYVRAMAATARGAAGPRPAGVGGRCPAAGTDGAAIILEGESGATAAARFVVENHLDQPISAPVCVSPLTSQRGHTADVRLRFEPEVVTLQPREQLLVCVGTRIDDRLADAGGYWGVLGVPDLPGTELVVVLRRALPAASVVSRPAARPTDRVARGA